MTSSQFAESQGSKHSLQGTEKRRGSWRWCFTEHNAYFRVCNLEGSKYPVRVFVCLFVHIGGKGMFLFFLDVKDWNLQEASKGETELKQADENWCLSFSRVMARPVIYWLSANYEEAFSSVIWSYSHCCITALKFWWSLTSKLGIRLCTLHFAVVRKEFFRLRSQITGWCQQWRVDRYSEKLTWQVCG